MARSELDACPPEDPGVIDYGELVGRKGVLGTGLRVGTSAIDPEMLR